MILPETLAHTGTQAEDMLLRPREKQGLVQTVQLGILTHKGWVIRYICGPFHGCGVGEDFLCRINLGRIWARVIYLRGRWNVGRDARVFSLFPASLLVL